MLLTVILCLETNEAFVQYIQIKQGGLFYFIIIIIIIISQTLKTFKASY